MATKTPSNKKTTYKKVTEKLEAISADLNERQKLFCKLYTTDKFCFGNATKSYIEAYGLTTATQKKNAGRMGYRLLINVHVKNYINALLDAGFRDEEVDRELSKVMIQDKDLRSKVTAITEYNKVKNRVKDVLPPATAPIVIHIAPEVAAKIST